MLKKSGHRDHPGPSFFSKAPAFCKGHHGLFSFLYSLKIYTSQIAVWGGSEGITDQQTQRVFCKNKTWLFSLSYFW